MKKQQHVPNLRSLPTQRCFRVSICPHWFSIFTQGTWVKIQVNITVIKLISYCSCLEIPTIPQNNVSSYHKSSGILKCNKKPTILFLPPTPSVLEKKAAHTRTSNQGVTALPLFCWRTVINSPRHWGLRLQQGEGNEQVHFPIQLASSNAYAGWISRPVCIQLVCIVSNTCLHSLDTNKLHCSCPYLHLLFLYLWLQLIDRCTSQAFC